MDSMEQREYTIETRMLQRLIKPLTVWNAVVEVCSSWIVYIGTLSMIQFGEINY